MSKHEEGVLPTNNPTPKRAMIENETDEIDVVFVEGNGKIKPRRAKANISKIATSSGVGLALIALIGSAFTNPVFAGDTPQYAVPAAVSSSSSSTPTSLAAEAALQREYRAVNAPTTPDVVASSATTAPLPSTTASMGEVKAVSGSSAIASTNIANGRLAWPLDSRFRASSSSFGPRIHPIKHTRSFHTGMDIPASCGAAVYAASDGVVVNSGYTSGAYGNRIVLKHTAEISTTYSHMSAVKVTSGQTVREGDLIGLVGTTGLSTGCHMHFEVAKNGSYVNPWSWLTGKPDAVTDTVPFNRIYTQGSIPTNGSTTSPVEQEDAMDVELGAVKTSTPTVTASPTVSPSASATVTPSASVTHSPVAAPSTPAASPTPTPVKSTPPATVTPKPTPSPVVPSTPLPVPTPTPEPVKSTPPAPSTPPVETVKPDPSTPVETTSDAEPSSQPENSESTTVASSK